ncbi:hypothetical protein [Streptacidiphilus rugosus]|uniref:hypothetical protein n=1 Tax=Streptacidiphilus rugosus TaxID=405783 RepID=UPI000569CAA4|nr:hypothetical protein [Streptacidiphilus rugosus]
MNVLAVTGHVDPSSEPFVRAEFASLLAALAVDDPLDGWCCIAEGVGSIFAEELLAAGGRLHIVMPSEDYRETTVEPGHAETFDRLVASAVEVVTLPHATVSREAYGDANRLLLERASGLVAVWDGERSSEKGDAGDMVTQAEAAWRGVFRIWPGRPWGTPV